MDELLAHGAVGIEQLEAGGEGRGGVGLVDLPAHPRFRLVPPWVKQGHIHAGWKSGNTTPEQTLSALHWSVECGFALACARGQGRP